MKAVCWYGTGDIRVSSVPDPAILNPRDGELHPAGAVGALAADCPPGWIFEDCAVTSLDDPPIAADEVVLCTNAYTAHLATSCSSA